MMAFHNDYYHEHHTPEQQHDDPLLGWSPHHTPDGAFGPHTTHGWAFIGPRSAQLFGGQLADQC